uniref:cytochrome c oxidase subunit 2 n=1 Tax=Rhodella violacea TaxID=2801 RepID=UPI001FCE08A2|nr:cytochrome c oxidase subunit 2 [Rhodella violacea]UNJ19087.1 cytochrome c oxidase subunit 2 [Rhodella violacea]
MTKTFIYRYLVRTNHKNISTLYLILGTFLLLNKSFLDAPIPWQVSLQDSATEMMDTIIQFHNYLLCVIIFITVLVLWFLVRIAILFDDSKHIQPYPITHNTFLEWLWCLFPVLIVISISIPSLALLITEDQADIAEVPTIKIIGHQWYWEYDLLTGSLFEDSKSEPTNFDSYMVAEEDLEKGQFRLLEVDNRLHLPVGQKIRLLITSADVLHSWTVPSFGIKCDAVPGRLNTVITTLQRTGVFYGQCSEICGSSHALMPILVEACIPTSV